MSDKYIPPNQHVIPEVELIRNGNNIVSPAFNKGKDYIIIRKALGFQAIAAELEPGRRQVYVAIPELPFNHAYGDNPPFPIKANSIVAYKVPKAVLNKLAYKAVDDYGHYFVFLSAEVEEEHIKGKVTNLGEGVLTAPAPRTIL